MMLRNHEIFVLCLFCGGISLAAALAGFALSPAAGWLCLGLAGALNGAYALFTCWRYRQLRRLTTYLSGVYAGQRALDIRDNTEGELSILKNDLYKITVTLQQQSDRLQTDKTLLADALGDISHQLKTPLTSAIVMTDLLADPALPENKRQEFTQSLARQLDRMQWLVAALLKLSRLDAGAVAFARAPARLAALLEKAVEPLRIQMELQGVDYVCRCPDSAVWPCDENWTMQAIQNVLKNCVEQMPGGGRLAVLCTDDPLGCRIEITDTGGGIASEALPHLFERFYRGRRAGPDNAGIGLALAQSILRQQGGEICAENCTAAGVRGARFVITLPKQTV